MRWLVVALLVACGGRQQPREPSTSVRGEVELAEQAERKRQHDVARAHYDNAIALAHDPASTAFAHRELAETLASWGEFQEAAAHFETSVKLVDDASAWHNLGMLRHKLGNVPGAIAALEKARDLAPDNYQPRRSLAVIRWNAGDLAGARTEYQAMLELELPDKLREAVKTALQELSAKLAKP
jgi:tetratricopeptide (TPR) repeat protein